MINFSNLDNRIRITNENVNNLWYIKKLLTINMEYLENNIIDWKITKSIPEIEKQII